MKKKYEDFLFHLCEREVYEARPQQSIIREQHVEEKEAKALKGRKEGRKGKKPSDFSSISIYSLPRKLQRVLKKEKLWASFIYLIYT